MKLFEKKEKNLGGIQLETKRDKYFEAKGKALLNELRQIKNMLDRNSSRNYTKIDQKIEKVIFDIALIRKEFAAAVKFSLGNGSIYTEEAKQYSTANSWRSSIITTKRNMWPAVMDMDKILEKRAR